MKELRYELNFRVKFTVGNQDYRFTSVTKIVPKTRTSEEKRIVEETVQIIKPYDDADYYRADRTFLEFDEEEGTDEETVWKIIRNKEVVKTIASEGKMDDYKFMTAEVLHELNKTVKAKMMHN